MLDGYKGGAKKAFENWRAARGTYRVFLDALASLKTMLDID